VLEFTTKHAYRYNTMTQDEEWLLKEKYSGEKTPEFILDCARLNAREPLAYIIGSVPFLHTQIYLDSHPLIPRAETEFWVEKVISELQTVSKEKSPTVLDLCAGSGCIGIAVLKDVPNAHVDFVEIETMHHETIRKNIEKNGIDISRTILYGGDLFSNLTTEYDYILTNPPYIDALYDRTEVSVRTFEPHTALYGGERGMELILKIISTATSFLKDDGVLFIEHEPEQSLEIATLSNVYNFTCETHLDQFGVPRYSRLTLHT